jgi:hypothetical protein
MEVTSKLGAPSGVLQATAPPLDYSFKELRSCSEMETEEPRGGGVRRHPATTDKDPAITSVSLGGGDHSSAPMALQAPGGTMLPVSKGGQHGLSPKKIIRKVCVAVKLNNNMIETITDLPQSLEPVMDNPLLNCQWLDLSYNQLASIEPALLEFKNLKALYLHGNQIKSLPSVERLRKLPKLISLTLNGNQIERALSYRMYVIGALKGLRSLDHSTITEEERTNAHNWFEAHMKRLKAKKEQQEEVAANTY